MSLFEKSKMHLVLFVTRMVVHKHPVRSHSARNDPGPDSLRTRPLVVS